MIGLGEVPDKLKSELFSKDLRDVRNRLSNELFRYLAYLIALDLLDARGREIRETSFMNSFNQVLDVGWVRLIRFCRCDLMRSVPIVGCPPGFLRTCRSMNVTDKAMATCVNSATHGDTRTLVLYGVALRNTRPLTFLDLPEHRDQPCTAIIDSTFVYGTVCAALHASCVIVQLLP